MKKIIKKNNSIIKKFYLFIPFLPVYLAAAPPKDYMPLGPGLSTNMRNKANNFAGWIGLQDIDIIQLMQIIVTILMMLLSTLFLGLIFYGGYRWMMAKGNENEVEEARGIIRHAIIGLIVTLSSYALGYFILFYLLTGGGGTGAPLGAS